MMHVRRCMFGNARAAMHVQQCTFDDACIIVIILLLLLLLVVVLVVLLFTSVCNCCCKIKEIEHLSAQSIWEVSRKTAHIRLMGSLVLDVAQLI